MLRPCSLPPSVIPYTATYSSEADNVYATTEPYRRLRMVSPNGSYTDMNHVAIAVSFCLEHHGSLYSFVSLSGQVSRRFDQTDTVNRCDDRPEKAL